MIQEILTYLIIIVAVVAAIVKSYSKLKGKKRNLKTDFSKVSMTAKHDCNDCSAECMLRNTIKTSIKTELDLCKTIEVKNQIL